MIALLLLACAPAASDGPAEASDSAPTDATPPVAMTLSSPDWLPSEGHPLAEACPNLLPVANECGGPSPALVWSGVPEGTVSLVLIHDDPDAGDYPHWAVFGLPPDSTGLPGGASGQGLARTLPEGAGELTNGFDWIGYLGSCPPAPHTYRWRLWALDQAVEGFADGGPSSDFGRLARFAREHALGKAEACHVYGPKAEGS